MRWCTKPGCPGSMRGESLDTKKVTCPDCRTEVCFQCRDEWHGSRSCEDNMSRKLEGWVNQHGGVRFCPVCKTKVEKNEGCNHMHCIICNYEFCWFCLGYAGVDSYHFDPTSPYACGATQHGNFNSRWFIINFLAWFALYLVLCFLAAIVYVLYFLLGGLF